MNIRFYITSFTIFYLCSLGGITGLNRTIRQASCAVDQFLCKRGGCISISDVCNGLSQCSDNSDEDASLCDCGTGAVVGNINKKTAGAHEAPPGAQPWFVGIYKVLPNDQYSLICSGTLIYDDIVLTSAYCVTDPDTRLIYLTHLLRISIGKLDRDYNIDEPIQQKLKVRQILKRLHFDQGRKGYSQNLAIIKLERHIKKTEYLRPACMWTQRLFPAGERRGIIAGWGLDSSGTSGVKLMESLVSLIDTNVCIRQFVNPRNRDLINYNQCCMTFDEGVNINEKLAGGPVTVLHEGRYYIVAVLSVQKPNSPFGIATKISRYVDWIERTVYDLKESESTNTDEIFDRNCFKENLFNCSSSNQCIRKDLVCNNMKDCDDGSDEDPYLCDAKPPPNPNGLSCEIPESSEIFTASRCGESHRCKNKFYAPTNSIYEITCPNGRGFAKPGVTNMSTVCLYGKWIPDLKESKCLKLCSPQEFKSLELDCQYQGSHVDCNEMMRPGTVIKVQCKRHFKKQMLVNYAEQTTCRNDGALEHDISTECIPVCGVPYDNKAQILLSNANKTLYAKYPWHTGLYWKVEIEDGIFEFRYQCGGTLIDSNKVLTAGHCIWETGRNVKDPNDVVVTFGKYYSSWNLKEDLEQRHRVSKIIPGNHYNGATTKYSQDIAVLILANDVTVSNYIMPACLDLNGNFGGVPKNQLGLVVGWGRLSENESETSHVLRETFMEYLDLDTCRKRFDRFNFNEFLQSDKVCTVYKNGSGTQMGDSGGGLTFTHDSLHYVYGVVSIKKSGQNEFAALTNVMSHASWLRDILQLY